jgi:hypothetical protein
LSKWVILFFYSLPEIVDLPKYRAINIQTRKKWQFIFFIQHNGAAFMRMKKSKKQINNSWLVKGRKIEK